MKTRARLPSATITRGRPLSMNYSPSSASLLSHTTPFTTSLIRSSRDHGLLILPQSTHYADPSLEREQLRVQRRSLARFRRARAIDSLHLLLVIILLRLHQKTWLHGVPIIIVRAYSSYARRNHSLVVQFSRVFFRARVIFSPEIPFLRSPAVKKILLEHWCAV